MPKKPSVREVVLSPSRMAYFVHHVGAGEKAAQDLTDAEASEAAHLLLSGEATPLQIGGFLVGMRIKTETPIEIAAFTTVCRAYNLPWRERYPGLLDIPSYAGKKLFFHAIVPAAFLMAAAGQPVLLHGFREISGRLGIAAVLEALGISTQHAIEEGHAILETCGFLYLDVAQFNPPLGRFHQLRNELGVRTIFNAVSRAINPAGAGAHFVGISHPPYFSLTLAALKQAGSERALIVRGVEGGPEPSAISETQGWRLDENGEHPLSLAPDQIGFKKVRRIEIPCGDADEQAALTRGILAGTISGPPRDWVIYIAACGLYAAGKCASLAEAKERIEMQLENRAGLARWVASTQ